MDEMDMIPEDDCLVLRAAEGDAAAFRMLLERHYDAVYRTAYRLVGIREDAEDITQTVCSILVDRLSQFRGHSKFTTWLYRIVVNTARDHRRKQIGTERLQQAYGESLKESFELEAESRAEIAWLYDALKRLTEEARETAVLVLSMGFSHAEAADILGVRESTVSWRMHELRGKLKDMAKEDLQ